MTESYIKAIFRTGQRVRFRQYPNDSEGGSPFDGVGRLARVVPDTDGRTVWGYHIDLRIFDDGRSDKAADLYFPHQVFDEEVISDGEEDE